MNYSMYICQENSMFLKEGLAEIEGGKLAFEQSACCPLLIWRHGYFCATSQNSNLECRHGNYLLYCFILFSQISTQYFGLETWFCEQNESLCILFKHIQSTFFLLLTITTCSNNRLQDMIEGESICDLQIDCSSSMSCSGNIS